MLRRRTLAAAAVMAVTVLLLTYGTLRSGSSGNSQTDGPALEIELITLRPAGFEPLEIVRPKGSFVLFIDDRSGKKNSSLVLQHEKGERVRAVNLNRKKSEWNDVVDLAPGSYVLQDAAHPEWRCQITILP
jgi:hypothetical protein